MKKTICRLVGTDGNIFNLVGRASSALKADGKRAEAEEMAKRVFKAESYDEALMTIMEYVEEPGYDDDFNEGTERDEDDGDDEDEE